MKTTLFIFTILTLNLLGQKPCNIDKYVLPENVKVDSNNVIIFYTNDDKYFIAYKKDEKDSLIKFLFYKKIFNYKSLINLANNSVVVGAPLNKTDSLGNITYYSYPDDAYIKTLKSTYVLHAAKLKVLTGTTFLIDVKFQSGQFNFNYEMKYTCDKPLKNYRTFADRINHSKMTCINASGVDM